MILNLVSNQSWGNIKQNESTVNFKAWDEPNEKKHIHTKWVYMGIKIMKDFQTSKVAFHKWKIHTPKTCQSFIMNFGKLKPMLFNSIFLAMFKLGFGSKNLSSSIKYTKHPPIELS
jgi:hypothetical protein